MVLDWGRWCVASNAPAFALTHSLTGRGLTMITSLGLLLTLIGHTLAVSQCDVVDCSGDQRASWGYQASNGPVYNFFVFKVLS